MPTTRASLAELREEMRGVARGERRPSALPAGALLPVLAPATLELMGVMIRERPRTVAELAAFTGRAQSNVSRSLQHLARLGLIRLVREGKEVRPEPAAGELRVDLASGTYAAVPLR